MPVLLAAAIACPGSILVGLRLLSFTFVEAGHTWPNRAAEPQPLRLGVVDYGKALVAWLLGFRRTYAVEPGLYFTGDSYDVDQPLLVTANYHLSVFLVARRVRRSNARLLVIDTDGINVWCAAGKGRFGNDEIQKQLRRYPRELLTLEPKPRLILPKFGMSGVDLQALRDEGTRPVVGPLYARDLPEYLAARPFRNRAKDRVRFDLQSRAFVCLPGLLQVAALSAMMAVGVWVLTLPWATPLQFGIIAISVVSAAAYALLFPILPGRRFAVKGLVLGALFSGVLLALALADRLSMTSLWFAVPFTVAAGILIGLEFTGNSAVSNYSKVKREMVAFLPVSVVLFVVSAAAFVAVGVLR
jgi:acetyl-CoA decarbonylase/synthase complex subunit gamma